MTDAAKPNLCGVWWQDLLGWDIGKEYLDGQRWLTDTMTECDYLALDGTVWTVLADSIDLAPEGYVACGFPGVWPGTKCLGECAMPVGHESPHVWQQSCVEQKIVILGLSSRSKINA